MIGRILERCKACDSYLTTCSACGIDFCAFCQGTPDYWPCSTCEKTKKP